VEIVRANLPSIKDQEFLDRVETKLGALKKAVVSDK
jgi:hypothetical protein